ncbi:zinc transporter ZntB [Magnetovibrio sp.]|uniref:zinc transporter ZntB n=1 Tax=Magnetovibrio sp. TaxID=2024836 RepID=UPI002F9344F5
MSEHSHLICAYLLDGRGSGQEIDWAGVNSWTADQGAAWVHLDCADPDTESWLREHSRLDTFVVDGLLAEESRPRCDWYEDGVLLVLRGVNLNPGAVPEDMVSIRMWIDEHRVISTRFRRLMAVEDIRAQLSSGKGPTTPGHLVARLAARMTDRMGPTIEGLGDLVVDLEGQLIGADSGEPLNLRDLRTQLIDCRRIAITLRRYINPQREALVRLSQLDEQWLDDRVEGRLRETIDRVTRMTEELDEVRERSSMIQDELVNRASQRMERTMYTLTIVATIMLPLGFLTGLLGINVGGIPGGDTPWAFWVVCAIMAILVLVEIVVLRRFKWI